MYIGYKPVTDTILLNTIIFYPYTLVVNVMYILIDILIQALYIPGLFSN